MRQKCSERLQASFLGLPEPRKWLSDRCEGGELVAYQSQRRSAINEEKLCVLMKIFKNS